MPSTTFDSHGVQIDGVPALLQAGTLHYFRLPHADLWAPVLERLRMGGFNAVVVPFPWAYHSPAHGIYDFTGPRDVRYLLDETERVGLWLVVHVGPWIGATLAAGGVPPWLFQLRDAAPDCASGVPPGPSFPFLREVEEWWDRLIPFFSRQPNLLFAALDPGQCSGGSPLPRYVRPLVEMARNLGLRAPIVTPGADPAGPPQVWTGSPAQPAENRALVRILSSPPMTWGGDVSPRYAPTTEHPRPLLNQALAEGITAYTLTPVHAGSTWGYWGSPEVGTASGVGAPVGAGGALPAAYFFTRRETLLAESLGETLTRARAAEMIYPSEPRFFVGARAAGATNVAFLGAEPEEEGETRLSLPLGDEMLTTEPVPLAHGSARILPLEWPLAESVLRTTTLEPVLQTFISGRYLLVLANAAGGDLLLSDDFRLRHARGPVRTRRTQQGLTVHFEAARVASILLDGLEAPLQLLALEPEFAARVWPLDDTWRTTPAYPAAWNPDMEDPARGLVIGPEFVVPRGDGSFDFLVSGKGFGYRWGPWRGSDPHTWLAPLTWREPELIQLPELNWTSRPGAPEAEPGFDDGAWRQVAQGAPLAMERHDISFGFAWYRGAFSGQAQNLTLRCRHACDLFLNGAHIARINEPPEILATAPKTIPLPPARLREHNLLALLSENMGRGMPWDAAALEHGLLEASLDSGAPIRWRLRAGISGERTRQGFPGFADWSLVPEEGAPVITWHRAIFSLNLPKDVEVPIYLFLERVPTKAYVFLNGQLIGRYWDGRGPQRRFWLPEGILRRGGMNELLVAQWVRGAEPGMGTARLEAGRVLQWRHESDSRRGW